ncbi:MAG: hypothetical protein C0603_13300 [Denitrovibrio sp.]|nr:MAG: hypothetical protein C0603_13300 [Denitrovibrio sp.]
MENMSILNLFSAQPNIELPKEAASTGQGEFENVFKKYLDRSEKPAETDTAETKSKSVKAEEPETPEEVIENLDIPKEEKAELKRLLAEAESPEDVKKLLDRIVEMMQEAGEAVGDIETAMTDIAKSILGSEGDRTPKENIILEQSLDKIVALQTQQKNTPQLTVVKTDGKTTQEDTSKQNEPKKEAFLSMVQKNSEYIPADIKDKLLELATEAKAEKPNTNNIENNFTLKSDESEKVIKAEIRIESPRDIMKFAELVELAKNQKATKLNIQLHPQELGRVNIELTEQAGKISGKVMFESETARNLFANNAEGLRQQLADKGVTVENLEFLFSESEHHEFAGWEGREGKGSRKGGNINMGVLADLNNEQETDEADGVYA